MVSGCFPLIVEPSSVFEKTMDGMNNSRKLEIYSRSEIANIASGFQLINMIR